MNEEFYPIKDIVPEQYWTTIPDICSEPSCKSPLLINAEMTRKRCSNISCPLHLKYRASSLLKYLGINGIAEETCYKIIKEKSLLSHFDVLPYVLDYKPSLELWEIAKFCFIQDISDEWVKYLGGKSELNYHEFPVHLRQYFPLICVAVCYFNIKKIASHDVTINIAVHGSLGSYGTRDDFVANCNSVVNNTVYTILKKSVTYDTDYLVTYQQSDTSCRKVRDALNKNIPIISPDEYVQVMAILTSKERVEGER